MTQRQVACASARNGLSDYHFGVAQGTVGLERKRVRYRFNLKNDLLGQAVSSRSG